MRCLLMGNYGAGNIGDEALREYFLASFGDVSWQVVSAVPQFGELARLPLGLRSLCSTPWWRTFHAIRHADALVFGGGSLFTDAESVKACLLWGMHACAAWMVGTPIVLAFQGIGPLKTTMGKRITAFTLHCAAFVMVRDEESVARVRELSPNTKMILSADPIFLTNSLEDSDRTQNVVAVIPRHNSDPAFTRAFTDMLHAQKPSAIRLLSLQPDDPQERRTLEALRLLAPDRCTIVPLSSFEQLLQELGKAAHTLTQRYHGAIGALIAQCPVDIIPQKEGDKLWALRQTVERSSPQEETARLKSLARAGESALRDFLKTYAKMA